MNKITLSFEVNEQNLKNTSEKLLMASDTVDYVDAVFSLGLNWDSFDSVRAIWKGAAGIYSTVLDSENHCTVPVELFTVKGAIKVNLVGSIAEEVEGETVLTDRLTTFQVVALSVSKKVPIEGDETSPLTPSQFEQFVLIVRGYADDAADAKDAAETAQGLAEDALTEVQTAWTTALSDIGSAKTTAVGEVQQAQTAGVAAVEEASSDIISDMANPYDSTKTYKVGEHCLYQNQLYVCTTSITTAEAWTAVHWKEVNVGDELTDLKEEFDEHNELLFNQNEYVDASNLASTTNSAIIYNGDGTYTIGTTGYGNSVFGWTLNLSVGWYYLFGVPNGIAFLSTTSTASQSYANRVFENTDPTPKLIYVSVARQYYCCFRSPSRPSEPYIIAPSLYSLTPKHDADYEYLTEHIVKYNVMRLDDIYRDVAQTTSNGITWSCADGLFTVSGTAESAWYVRLFFSQNTLPSWIEYGRTYQVKFSPTGSNVADLFLQIALYKSDGSYEYILSTNHDASFTMPDDIAFIGMIIRLYVGTGKSVNGKVEPAILNTQSNEMLGGTIDRFAEYNAYALMGKHVDVSSRTTDGITWSCTDGVFNVSGTATSSWFVRLYYNATAFPPWVERGKTYYVKFDPTGSDTSGLRLQVAIYRADTTYEYICDTTSNTEVHIPESTEFVGMLIRIFVATGESVNGVVEPAILDSRSNQMLTMLTESTGRIRIFPKKIAFFGASEVWGRDGNGSSTARTPHKFPDTISQMLNVQCDNYGVGSLGYVHAGGDYANAYDLISSTDLSPYDTILMIYGGNDGFSPLGTADSTDETTIMGQFNKIVNYIYTQKNDVRLIVIAPMNGANVGTFPQYWYGPRSGEYPSRQVLSDTLKERCEYFNIPYIEQTTSPLNGFTIRDRTVMGADGVHLSNYGYQRVGEWLAGQIASLIG